jgi:protein TonB
MNWKAGSMGVISAAAVLLLLVAARMLVARAEISDLEIREIEISTEPEPPPPPPPEEPPPLQPPPPALTQVEAVADPLRVPVPKADAPVDVTMPVDAFFTEIAPAPLPVTERPRSSPSATRPAPPKPVAKSRFSLSELDGRPRLLRHPSVAFPRELASRGVRSGTVVLEVELSTSGSVSVRKVLSTSHPELVAPARRVAAGSRFTSPKRNGQPVKAVMRWPITIQQ